MILARVIPVERDETLLDGIQEKYLKKFLSKLQGYYFYRVFFFQENKRNKLVVKAKGKESYNIMLIRKENKKERKKLNMQEKVDRMSASVSLSK